MGTQNTEYKITLSKTLNIGHIGHFYLLLFNINTPPLIKLFLPLSSSSPPFCLGIASPHFPLASFEFGPIGFGE